MKLEDVYQYFLEKAANVITDTRLCKSGDIFISLKGENFDGNQYARKALELGCSLAIIDNKDYMQNEKTVLVEDSLDFLQKLAYLHRQTLNLPILAITGSNGKTTTKELIVSVLKKKFVLGYTKGNYNNHIGVPLTLLSFSENTDFGVVEMGANHPGEINSLCKIADPNFGIITNIGKAHIEGFGTFQGVIDTKNELYQYLNTKNGLIFYNSGNEILTSLSKNNKYAFGGENDDIYAEIIEQNPFLKIKIFLNQKDYIINTKIFGEYNLENIMAAFAIGHYFGIEASSIINAIETYRPENNRSQLVKTKENTVFLDAYNANPSSMEKAIENFLKIDGKKAMILGDMLELGNISEVEHIRIVKLIEKMGMDNIFLVGKNFKSLSNKQLLSFEDVEGLIEHLRTNPIKAYNILVKGSRGTKLEKVIDFI
ncbi:MAG: UDP-N-acetylmuramoyl-tripeptide--D-alanyl-D-alanine ligase [Bacteroidales bacterium]|nr:UDP-N-acetylmuramoyl-tripeptide--D-alanyl-D-alanine ligase [Bacteroidales bacterium]